jgi:hypothetical protein
MVQLKFGQDIEGASWTFDEGAWSNYVFGMQACGNDEQRFYST